MLPNTNSMKLSDLEFKIFKAIGDKLDIDSSWRNLIEVTSHTKFQLNDIETEKCARSLYTGGSPSMTLLRKFDSIGMTVDNLSFYLEKLKFEDCLRYLKKPEPLKITRQPSKEIQICGGKKLEISCEAVGFPYPEYVWFKGSNRIGMDKKGALVIKCARPQDTGTYTCRVQHHTSKWSYVMSESCKVHVDPSNQATSDHYEEIFNIEHKATHLPSIVLQPTNKTSECGGPVVFKVVAHHPTHHLGYQWFHNTRPISNATQNELRIEDVSKKDAGSYQVRIFSPSNERIQTMSKVATLEVNPEPNQYTAGDKVALVIGNGAYRSYGQELLAVEHDLYYTTVTFEKMGFKVISLLDLTLEEMRKAVDFFCDLISKDAYVIFYCMGHGFLYDGKHFLVPWDLCQGNNVKECLCIESCMKKIQDKCPKLLMVLVDLCRQYVEHSGIGDAPKEKPSKSLPNYVIIYATILGEQSFEESGKLIKPRGLFNKYLLDVLDSPDVKVKDIYDQLQSKFQRCPYNKNKFPQHPQMDITLEEPDRCLWDPVANCYHSSNLSNTKMMQDITINRTWQYAHVIPGHVHIPLESRGLIVLSFSKYLSNVLLMRPIITNFNPSSYKIEIELHKERVSQILQPVRVIANDPPEYKFCNLQRLKSNMTICLTINIVTADKQVFKLETELIDLGEPMVASLTW